MSAPEIDELIILKMLNYLDDLVKCDNVIIFLKLLF